MKLFKTCDINIVKKLVSRCSNVIHNLQKLNIDSNRNTKNIKIIKIAVENANLGRKKYAICALCRNMRKVLQRAICGNHIFT